MTDDARPTILRTTFELRPRDGSPPVRGDLRVAKGAKPKTAVVVLHGFKGFRTWAGWPSLARALAARGHAAVNVDFSHNGVGEDGVDYSALELFRTQLHTRNVDEVRMVLDALADGSLAGKKIRRVGLFGHSRGGGEAVLAAAEDDRVKALVTWAAIADIPGRWTAEEVDRWRRGEDVVVENVRTGHRMPIAPAYWEDVEANRERLDILRAAAAVTAPWLIVHGDADPSVPVEEGRRLYDAAGDNAELMTVEGADHTFGMKHPYAGATPELRTAAEATLEWFDEHLA